MYKDAAPHKVLHGRINLLANIFRNDSQKNDLIHECNNDICIRSSVYWRWMFKFFSFFYILLRSHFKNDKSIFLLLFCSNFQFNFVINPIFDFNDACYTSDWLAQKLKLSYPPLFSSHSKTKTTMVIDSMRVSYDLDPFHYMNGTSDCYFESKIEINSS